MAVSFGKNSDRRRRRRRLTGADACLIAAKMATIGASPRDPLVLTHDPAARPNERSFNPYDMNGGTVLAIAGADFTIVAADTRMTSGMSIVSRNQSKVYKMGTDVVLASGGFRGDILTLQKILKAQMTQYEHKHGEGMKVHAIARDLSNTLYGRRFFPYYTWNLLGGLDMNGEGTVYTYDPVGNYERVRVSCSGTAEPIIQPLLDNQFERQHQSMGSKPPVLSIDLSLDDTLDLVKDAFCSAGQRDTLTGDTVEICIITKAGVRVETFAINHD